MHRTPLVEESRAPAEMHSDRRADPVEASILYATFLALAWAATRGEGKLAARPGAPLDAIVHRANFGIAARERGS